MGTTKTRGVILAREGEASGSRPTRLARQGESGHWQETVWPLRVLLNSTHRLLREASASLQGR
jgi:hypothetical protein